MENGFFQRMGKEAMEELAGGEQGWRDAPSNVLIMACLGMLTNHLSSKITKPLWLVSSSISVAVLGHLIHTILGG